MNHNIFLIRHAKTETNFLRKYIGVTDDQLCESGITELKKCISSGHYPAVDYVFVSPLLRCQQTREMIYNGVPFEIIPELAECDFGIFENMNYEQLKDTREYQNWINNGVKGNFPQGENIEDFKSRCAAGFEKAVTKIIEKRIVDCALVIHGGTIMAILEKYDRERSNFHDWKLENCEGYKLLLETGIWNKEKKLTEIIKL